MKPRLQDDMPYVARQQRERAIRDMPLDRRPVRLHAPPLMLAKVMAALRYGSWREVLATGLVIVALFAACLAVGCVS